jgi:hypothetical protein
MKLSDQSAAKNQEILLQIQAFGGGYVWEAEIFAVTLMNFAVTDSQALTLLGLTGVEQIALNASNLSFPTIAAIARIPALESLVLAQSSLSNQQILELKAVVPELVLVGDEA